MGVSPAQPGVCPKEITNSPTVQAPDAGTASNSSPHADSREMVFDAAGDLIEVDDGGVYRRTLPRSNQGDWITINGDLQTTEQHDLAYDANAKVLLSGNQDTGSPSQLATGEAPWLTFQQADGGDVAVDDFSIPGVSVRYTSFQSLQGFTRSFWDAQNNFLSSTRPLLTPLGGVPRISGQFTTPIAVNAAEGQRLLIGGANGLYESFDRGDTVARIATLVATAAGAESLAYGAANNPHAIYLGQGQNVWVRRGAPPSPLVLSASLGATVVGVVMHPDDANTALVTTTSAVFWTTNGGVSWTNVTADLQSRNPSTLRSIEYVTSPSGNAVIIGSLNGIYYATEASGFSTWRRLGAALPTVPVYDLHYSRVDDVLVAGTLGRGAWKLRAASKVLTGGRAR